VFVIRVSVLHFVIQSLHTQTSVALTDASTSDDVVSPCARGRSAAREWPKLPIFRARICRVFDCGQLCDHTRASWRLVCSFTTR
jgi:hypothetical protein